MPKRSTTLHVEFSQKTLNIDNIRGDFENAFNNNHINDVDIIQAYAGLYLDLFTVFENLLETLFVGILAGDVYHVNGSVNRKLRITPQSEVESVLLSGKKYLDWLPYKEKTIDRAKIYFVDGKPFTNLSQNDKDELANYHKIRNAIAHKSKKALKDFNNIINGLTLTPIEKTPQGFLRNKPQGNNNQTQLEIISDKLKTISNTLCN